VGQLMPDWKWSFLTVPAGVFEDHLRWLAREGFRSVGLGDLHDHVSGKRALPPKSIVLTFDDGYLDNWTHAAPLLRRHGFTATVFVNPDFVDPRPVIRPTTEDVREGRAAREGVGVRGFMSWPELIRLGEEGTISAQSHLMTHTWYPVGPEVLDFHRPFDGQYWLDWNLDPARKPFYLEDPNRTRVPWGTPIYENRKSVAAVRWEPDPEEGRCLADHVEARGGPEFFERPGWREELLGRLEEFRTVHPPRDVRESGEDRRCRLEHEIVGSKREIERRLGRPAEFMAWPGGGYDETSKAMARGVYRSMTLSSSERRATGNRPGDDPAAVSRLGIPAISVRGRMLYHGGKYLTLFLQEQDGNRAARRRRQALKAFDLAFALAFGRLRRGRSFS